MKRLILPSILLATTALISAGALAAESTVTVSGGLLNVVNVNQAGFVNETSTVTINNGGANRVLINQAAPLGTVSSDVELNNGSVVETVTVNQATDVASTTATSTVPL